MTGEPSRFGLMSTSSVPRDQRGTDLEVAGVVELAGEHVVRDVHDGLDDHVALAVARWRHQRAVAGVGCLDDASALRRHARVRPRDVDLRTVEVHRVVAGLPLRFTFQTTRGVWSKPQSVSEDARLGDVYAVAVDDWLGVSGTVHEPHLSAVALWKSTPAVSSCATLTTTELRSPCVVSAGPVVGAREPIVSSRGRVVAGDRRRTRSVRPAGTRPAGAPGPRCRTSRRPSTCRWSASPAPTVAVWS